MLAYMKYNMALNDSLTLDITKSLISFTDIKSNINSFISKKWQQTFENKSNT